MINNRIFAKTRAALQSRKPFEELYLEYVDRVYWYLLLRVSNPQVAQDLTSQTFLKAYQAYADLRRSERFAPWIFRIARNLSIDYYRRSQSPDHSALELSEDLVSHGFTDTISQPGNLNKLPFKTSFILIMAALAGSGAVYGRAILISKRIALWWIMSVARHGNWNTRLSGAA